MYYTEWKIITNDLNLLSISAGDEKGLILSATYPKYQVGLTSEQANLIAAAVNGCISVNPDNPQVVAESIKDMYEALKTLDEMIDRGIPIVGNPVKQLNNALSSQGIQASGSTQVKEMLE